MIKINVLNIAFKIFLLLIVLFSLSLSSAQDFTIARVKYDGGGDWYNDPDEELNLAQELNKRTNIKADVTKKVVGLNDENLFQCPFLYLTGHGNINFSDDEVKRLRDFLINGGFLYADDDYGMDESFRREMKKVFPENEFVELPSDHLIYHIIYNFAQGLPKIHEHYEGPPKGLGIFYQGRLVVYYTWNTNITDGWTDAHNDPQEKREQASRMGINIVAYVLTH